MQYDQRYVQTGYSIAHHAASYLPLYAALFWIISRMSTHAYTMQDNVQCCRALHRNTMHPTSGVKEHWDLPPTSPSPVVKTQKMHGVYCLNLSYCHYQSCINMCGKLWIIGLLRVAAIMQRSVYTLQPVIQPAGLNVLNIHTINK